MTTPVSPASEKAWAMIDKEKRRDRLLRRVSIAAWSVTFGVVLVFAVIIGAQVSDTMRSVEVGVAPQMAVYRAAMPLLVVLGILSVLIATLSTVGVFLRLRTASLAEIQLRLAALEDMLTSRTDHSHG
jgi:hypothetical protein